MAADAHYSPTRGEGLDQVEVIELRLQRSCCSLAYNNEFSTGPAVPAFPRGPGEQKQDVTALR